MGHRVRKQTAVADDFGLLDTDTPAPNPGTGEDGKPEKVPELVYGTAEEFLHVQLLPTYVRSVTGKTAKWCIEWFSTPKPSPVLRPFGVPGSTCASTRQPA
jgi:hypothetical protein